MSDYLFDVPECKSPKLRWMEKHGIRTERIPDGFRAWHGPRDDKRGPLFMADDDSEDSALLELAVMMGIKSWREEVCHD